MASSTKSLNTAGQPIDHVLASAFGWRSLARSFAGHAAVLDNLIRLPRTPRLDVSPGTLPRVALDQPLRQ
jgi:hypothetical protein